MSKEKKDQKENEKKGKVGERNRNRLKENENRKISDKKLGIDEWKLLG